MTLLLNNKMYIYIIIGIMSFGFMPSLLYADVPKSKKNNKNTVTLSRTNGFTAVVKGNNVSVGLTNNGTLIDYRVGNGMTLSQTAGLSDAGVQSMFHSSLWVSAINSSSEQIVAVIGDYTTDMLSLINI